MRLLGAAPYGGADTPRATLITMGGYNVLTFDGPGQGTVLLDQGLPMRADWESGCLSWPRVLPALSIGSPAISASAPDLVAALKCPHEFVTFTAAEGADLHCESGARLLFHARMFAWLDQVLGDRTGD